MLGGCGVAISPSRISQSFDLQKVLLDKETCSLRPGFIPPDTRSQMSSAVTLALRPELLSGSASHPAAGGTNVTVCLTSAHEVDV